MSQASHRLLYAGEADRLYRLRHGTVIAAYRNKRIPGRATTRGILVSAKRAEELWGAR